MRRTVARLVVVAYGALVAFALLLASGWAVNRFFVAVYALGLRLGVRTWSPEDYAAVANAVMFAPLAFALLVGWPRLWWWAVALVLTLVSAAVELVQGQLGREPSVSDVLLNAAGAVVGAALGAWRVKVSERSERLSP